MKKIDIKTISVTKCPYCDNCLECEYFCGISVVPYHDETKLVIQCGNPVQTNIY